MSNPTESAPRTDSVTGTPTSPDLVRRRGLFLALLGAYVVWMGLLIAMSIASHRPG